MGDFKLFTSLRYDPALVRVPGEGFTNAGWNQDPSAFYMLDLHRDRLLRAATYWGWTDAINAIAGDEGLKRLEVFLANAVRDVGEMPHRVKVELSQDGTLSHMKSPTPNVPLYNLFPPFLPSPGEEVSTQTEARGAAARKAPSKSPEYEVLVDTQPTTKSEFTHYKTTRRDMYDGARARGRLALADLKEVLLVNDDGGLVMEGSLTTCYFWRDGKWVTPVVPPAYGSGQGSGGNDGTTRRWALEKYVRPFSSALYTLGKKVNTNSHLVTEQNITASSLADGEECWLSNGVRGFLFGRVKLGA
ncbi:Aminodeoxychorismate lyase [Diatrype stigma]|uniref:Aminodeoxychorismate lyase n=1 Tax=Diatrype stigma TaxID=117547 RepID=A0AAN9YME8_9PEZI